MSAGPPAGKGTTRVSGLVGKAACARALASGRAARPATVPRRVMLNASYSRLLRRLCARTEGEVKRSADLQVRIPIADLEVSSLTPGGEAAAIRLGCPR